MVLSHVFERECIPNIQYAVKFFFCWKLFTEFIETVHVVIWINTFSSHQIKLVTFKFLRCVFQTVIVLIYAIFINFFTIFTLSAGEASFLLYYLPLIINMSFDTIATFSTFGDVFDELFQTRAHELETVKKG